MGVESYIRENRERIDRIASGFAEVSTERRDTQDFGGAYIEYDGALTVETRDMGGALVSGDQNTNTGSATGVAGDHRPLWNGYIEITSLSNTLLSGDTRDDQNADILVSGDQREWERHRPGIDTLSAADMNTSGAAEVIRDGMRGTDDAIEALRIHYGDGSTADHSVSDGSLTVRGTRGEGVEADAPGGIWGGEIESVEIVAASGKTIATADYNWDITRDYRILTTHEIGASPMRPDAFVAEDDIRYAVEPVFIPGVEPETFDGIEIGEGTPDYENQQLGSGFLADGVGYHASGDRLLLGRIYGQGEPEDRDIDLTEVAVRTSEGTDGESGPRVWMSEYAPKTKEADEVMAVSVKFRVLA